MEKVQWNSINKKQNGLEQLKNEKSSTLPGINAIIDIVDDRALAEQEAWTWQYIIFSCTKMHFAIEKLRARSQVQKGNRSCDACIQIRRKETFV